MTRSRTRKGVLTTGSVQLDPAVARFSEFHRMPGLVLKTRNDFLQRKTASHGKRATARSASPKSNSIDAGPIDTILSIKGVQAGRAEISFRGNVTKYFAGMAQYTLGKAYNNSSGIASFPANNYDLLGEWSRADSDQRHRFNLLGTMKVGRLFNAGVAVQAESGRPYTMVTGLDENRDGLALDRPHGVSRNSLEGPDYVGLDLRLAKDFALNASKKEKSPKITAAIDAFNVINRVNYSGYIGNLSSPFFGRAISSRPARRLQLSMRFVF